MQLIVSRLLARLLFTSIVLAGFLALNPPAGAQLPTATILGVVKDASGAVVPGATLTARHVESGQTRNTTSAADGSFRFPALPGLAPAA